MPEQLSSRLIGYRVKAARETANWTQERLAELLKLKDRQSVSSLENGSRRLKPDELVLLSDALGRDIEYFLDPFAVTGEAKFSWRASPALPEAHLDDFEHRAGQWIGLLRWLREGEFGRVNPLKFSLRLTKGTSFEEAIALAEDLVARMELGGIPTDRLIECVERKFDIPVLFVDAAPTFQGDSISGATCHLQDLGVIIINRNEPEVRRFYNLAHELFHVLTWDAMEPVHRESNSIVERGRTRRNEQLANSFAAGLLMPKCSLDLLIDKRRMTDIDHLSEVAANLRVSPSSLAWRLFNMKRIEEATRNALAQEHHRVACNVPKRFSACFVGMLHRAIDRGRISARKAAKTMGMGLPQLSGLFIEHSLTVPFEL